MAKTTPQMKFWQGTFGKEYTERNTYGPEELDRYYQKTLGITLTAMNRYLLKDLRIGSVLEVGCNIGMKLNHLQRMGYENLYGIELQLQAVERAKQRAKNIKIVQGSAFDIPFKDKFFDLVFTNGVLIHIDPEDLKDAMGEIHRCSKKYISGLEYFSEQSEQVPYHEKKNRLWRNNFPALYQQYFPGLKLLRSEKYYYRGSRTLCDVAFIFQK